ncbi:hypothetical protein SAMN06295912_12121 [Sphingomonas laterariae]|uniref:Uncharacterized protein n=1 Tax=Edaphosphingomonas laterariae TaxID=861865 RepID=A0A239I3G1_9SPHN|nr:benenodin family lasso peptide [Sphingomonas laterariae]SNS88021.1 hypothetical protein SAMN06295912_12121 [Sphingomonas laterariae]
MERIHEHDELIDLGTASVETRGPWGPRFDPGAGEVLIPGISDD